MDCRVANAPRSDESCVHCEAEDHYVVIARSQAVAIHGLQAERYYASCACRWMVGIFTRLQLPQCFELGIKVKTFGFFKFDIRHHAGY